MNEIALDVTIIVTGLITAFYGYVNCQDPDYDETSDEDENE